MVALATNVRASREIVTGLYSNIISGRENATTAVFQFRALLSVGELNKRCQNYIAAFTQGKQQRWEVFFGFYITSVFTHSAFEKWYSVFTDSS